MSNALSLADQIDDLLPQTQCEQCGYAGCRPYAEAIAKGEAHNKCPPGGDALQQRLATRLGRPSLALDIPEGSQPGVRLLAVIREDECIGCTKCIQACPVDAITGAAKLMHTVISHECTGCELCVAPCPVDCIDMVLHPQHQQPLPDDARILARRRHLARKKRLANKAALRRQRRQEKQKKRQANRTNAHISATVESDLAHLKANYQRAKTQHQQLQAAIAHMQRHGTTPAAIHQQRLADLNAQMLELKHQLETALKQENDTLVSNDKKQP